jgi:hypothetical protein
MKAKRATLPPLTESGGALGAETGLPLKNLILSSRIMTKSGPKEPPTML